MPNLESALSRICAMAGIHRKKTNVNDMNFHHPDTRAIFYEGKTYSIRKVSAFLKLLGGLEIECEYCGGYQSRHGQEGSRVIFDSFGSSLDSREGDSRYCEIIFEIRLI